MKVIAITRPGKPEVLRIEERMRPEPSGTELLIRVAGAGVNRADLLQRMGRYPPPAGAVADVPGLEYAGEVIATGPASRRFNAGDQVMGLVAGGGYSEYLCAPEETAMPVPASMQPAAGAAIPEAFLTAFRGLFMEGDMKTGERVLLRAATSGVGQAAVQLAAIAGARVIAGSRQANRLPALEELGADATFVDRAEGVRKAVGNERVNLALDLLGGAAFAENLELLRPGGRLVLIGLLAGSKVELELGALLTRQLSVHGFAMRSLPVWRKAAITRRFAANFLPAFESARLRPIVGKTFPLADAARAHAAMQAGNVFGKLILTP